MRVSIVTRPAASGAEGIRRASRGRRAANFEGGEGFDRSPHGLEDAGKDGRGSDSLTEKIRFRGTRLILTKQPKIIMVTAYGGDEVTRA